MPQKSNVEIWTSLRHDRMNFEHDQIRSGHAHQPFSVLFFSLSSFSTTLRPSSNATGATLGASTGFKIGWKRVEPAWPYLGNSFNERLRQRRSSTILGYGHSAFNSVIQCNLSQGVVPKTSHFETFHACYKMILALKLRIDFSNMFPISLWSIFHICSDYPAGWKLWKPARQRIRIPCGRAISLPDFWHLEAISCSFRCRISGSLFDCQVSDEFNFHRRACEL